MKKILGLLAALTIVGYGCGDDSSNATPPGGTDLCQTDPIGACSGDCAFEPPSSIDCVSACANVAAVCESGCAGQCEGITLDPTLCAAACEGTKAQRCTNLVFGCYDNNDTCNGVGNCVANGG